MNTNLSRPHPGALALFVTLLSLAASLALLWATSTQGAFAASTLAPAASQSAAPAVFSRAAAWSVTGTQTTTVSLPLVSNGWPPPSWHSQAVDAPHHIDADRMTQRSLAVDAAGHPHAAYGGDNLYHAWHDGTAWRVEVADGGRRAGYWASLALDSAGHPHIAYHQYDTMGCLKYAHFDGTTWVTEFVDCEGGNTGAYISLALDGADRPQIAYFSYAMESLKAARWDGTQWQIETVEAGESGVTSMVGVHNSIAVDGAGRPHITYSVAEWGADYLLKHATWDGTQWQIELIVEGKCCMENSLAADDAGGLHLVYQTQSDATTSVLRYARYTGGGVAGRRDGCQWRLHSSRSLASARRGRPAAL